MPQPPAPPRLPARDPHEPHRVASEMELLFDLVTVIAIAAVTAVLHHAIAEGHGAAMLPRFLLIFVSTWWAWMNYTWFSSAFDNQGALYRLLVMVIMTGELIFAGGAGYVEATLDLRWSIVGWCVMRVGMALLWLLAGSNPRYRRTCRLYAGGIVTAQALWVAVYLWLPAGSVAFFACAALVMLVEFSVPVIAEGNAKTPFHRHHIAERYGLLTIISLGEVMLSISAGFGMLYGSDAILAPALTALSGVVIVFTLFWLYFTDEESLVSTDFGTVFAWGYIQVLVFGGIAATGAGIAAELDLAVHHAHNTGANVAWWLGTALALVMVALWIARDRHHDLGFRKPALLVMPFVALLGAALGFSTAGFAAILLAALLWRVPLKRPVEPQI